MKQELINRISSCCLLPFSLMMTWIDSLIFPNDADGSFKAYLKTQIMSNGELRNEAWILLLQNGEFEENSPITSAVAVGWLQERTCPTCNQLEVIINALKISPNFPLFVETNVLDLIELDFDIYPNNKPSDATKNIAYLEGGNTEVLMVAKIPRIKIKGFDYIKDANPYLIVERFTNAKKSNGRKAGWKRDKTMKVLGGKFRDGWNGVDITITEANGYRPNDIPLTQPRQFVDLRLENYFFINIGNRDIPTRVGLKNETAGDDNRKRTQRISLRFRIGFKIGNEEKISRPLKYFSIFAKETSPSDLGLDNVSQKAVLLSFSKM